MTNIYLEKTALINSLDSISVNFTGKKRNFYHNQIKAAKNVHNNLFEINIKNDTGFLEESNKFYFNRELNINKSLSDNLSMSHVNETNRFYLNVDSCQNSSKEINKNDWLYNSQDKNTIKNDFNDIYDIDLIQNEYKEVDFLVMGYNQIKKVETNNEIHHNSAIYKNIFDQLNSRCIFKVLDNKIIKKENKNNFNCLKSKSKNILKESFWGLKEVSILVQKIMIEENIEECKIIYERIKNDYNINKEDLKKIKRRIYDVLNVIRSIKCFDEHLNVNIQKLSREKKIINYESVSFEYKRYELKIFYWKKKVFWNQSIIIKCL